MRRKHEIINGHRLSVWDCGEKYADRYTVVYLDEADSRGMVQFLGMGPGPFNPQGYCMHGEMPLRSVAYKGRGGAFKKRITFDSLPPDCQRAVMQDIGD